MELSSQLTAYLRTPEFVWHALFFITNGAFLFIQYVDWRQHRSISQPIRPKELNGLCSQEEYGKSHEYAVERSHFGMCQSIFDHFLGLFILFGNVMPVIWEACGQWISKMGFKPDSSEITQSLLYQGVFLLLNLLISLPWSIYSTFWIEARHGFNKTTVRTFITDLLKNLMLSTVLGGLLLSVMLWVIKWAGKNFVLYAVALSLFIQIVMVIIFPIIIQPLFNKFTPLEDGDLKTAVEELASKVEFPLKKILVIDGSKRSGHSNAYFFGLFKNKRIVLYDTLIQQMSIDEAVAIVGHELGHWAHNDMFWGLVLNQLNILWIFYLLSLAINYAPLYTAFGFKTQPLIIGINLFSQLLTPLSLALSFLLTWFSRLREFRADRYAIDHGYGEHLPKALIKMYKENKSLVHPDWLYSMMHNSHPPPSERVAAMNAYTTKISKKQ